VKKNSSKEFNEKVYTTCSLNKSELKELFILNKMSKNGKIKDLLENRKDFL